MMLNIIVLFYLKQQHLNMSQNNNAKRIKFHKKSSI